ncbi:protein disulfide-isomerase precursor [Sorochytrium milnesiophthora]
MRLTPILALVALLPFVLASASNDQTVLVLSDDNYTKEMGGDGLLLLKYYKYEAAAKELEADGIRLAEIDCTTSEDLCQKEGISGYPTLKVKRNGKVSEYKGGRKKDNIVSYMRRQALPHFSEIEAAKVADFVKKEKAVVFAFLKKKDSKAFKALDKLAQDNREDYLFGYSADAAALKDHTDGKEALVVFKQFDDGKAVYSDDLTDSAEVLKWIKAESVPLMDEVGPENFMSYVETGLPLAFFFYGDAEQRAKFGPELEKVAKQYKGKMNFVYTDATKFGGHAQVLNLKSEWPAFAINELSDDLKWPLPQDKEFDVKDVADLCQGFVDKTIEPTVKSEPVPESQDEPVFTVVNKNFNDIVMDTSKDVFIEFYAPSCGHCKRLAPTWHALAESLGKRADIIIAKMDATANDLPPKLPFKIEGFPTLKLFKAKTNEVVDFDGDRSLEGLTEFLRENAYHKDFELADDAASNKSSSETDAHKDHDEL